MGMQINQLSSATPSAGQSVPVYDPSKGDTRRWPLSDLLSWLQTNLSISGKPNTRYASPSATGFSVDINAGAYGNEDVHLILTPAAGYADGEIVLPISTLCVDRQIVVVNCTQTIGTLAVDGNGATGVFGAPTTIAAANEFFTLQYDIVTGAWYRIG